MAFSDVQAPKYVNRYYAYVTIVDVRFGHNVSNTDGLFKQVVEVLKKLHTRLRKPPR